MEISMEGINVICTRRLFIVLARPRLVVDGHELVLEWGKIRFVPLVPMVEHHLVLKLAHMGKVLGATRTTILLRPGEVRNYSYRPPLLFWPGALERVS